MISSIRNVIFLTIFFYALILLQTSFLVHFNIQGIIPNFVVLAVVLISFFERPEKKLGIISGLLGGIFLDVFSSNFLGFYTLILLVVAVFLKYILRRYVRLWT